MTVLRPCVAPVYIVYETPNTAAIPNKKKKEKNIHL